LKALSKDQLRKVERLVNEKVRADVGVITRQMPLVQAKKLEGLRAFFGEKYGEVVRVVELEDGYSRELCGGTHLERTGQIGLFKIIGEESVAKGIRRITAVTGERAYEEVVSLEETVEQASELLRTGPERIAERITALQKQIKDLNSRLASGGERSVKSFRAELAANAVRIGPTAVVIAEAPADERPEWMRTTADWLRKELDSVAVMLASKVGGKALLTAALSKDLVKRGLSASEWIESAAKVLGGKGGGKASLAQGGGPSPENISVALKQAYKDIKARLSES
jgi:alanyl-tRNA synthetase